MKIFKYILDMNRILPGMKYLSTVFLVIFFISAQVVPAQQPQSGLMVKGIVRDAHTKKPVAAARVSVLNGKTSTSTDENGSFSIEVKSANEILQVKAFDYNVSEVSVRGNNNLVINLYSEVFSNYYKNVEGVNGLVNNALATNSVKSVDNAENTHAFTADNILQTELGGNARSISRSAADGMGTSNFIRGINSINANAQPLYVVDGVIWNNMYDAVSIHDGYTINPLCNIDVNDIESVTVMKDGTSLYGSKASNGVVVIKTKRGTGMATKINLNIITGITTSPSTIPVMDADGYKVYASEMIGSAGLTNSEIAQIPFLYDDASRSNYKIYHNNTKWSDEVYQTAISKSYSINVNGGDDKALYYFSLGYTGNDGVVKSTDFQRYIMRLNGDISLAPKITLGINAGFSRIDRNMQDDGVNNYTSPTWLSLIKSPLLASNTYTYTGEKTTEYSYADYYNSAGNVLNVSNPMGVIKYSINTEKQNNFNLTLKPVYKITPEFTLSEHFDYNLNKNNEDKYRPYLYASPIYYEGIGYSYNNRSSQVMRNNSIFSDTRLAYTKALPYNQNLSAFVGWRYITNAFESDFVEGHNSMSNSSINLVGGFQNLNTDGVNYQNKTASGYANVDYRFNNRYMLNMAVSVDGSSRFGNEVEGALKMFGHSWGVFPSVNGAWLLTSEKFMKNIKAINLFKVRAGYGITGNDDIKDYQTLAYFSSVRLKGVANGIVLSSLANPSIQWETTRRANVGFDLSVLKDRLFLSVDAYSSVTDDLLVLRQYNDYVGLDSYWTNSGSLSNKGVEVELNAKLLNFRNFHWEMGLSAGHYVNEILSLPANQQELSNFPDGAFTTDVYDGQILSAVGHSAGVFYGYKTQGVFATEAEAAAANLKMKNSAGGYTAFGAGDVHFVDVKQDGIIDENDKQIIGDPTPLVYGSFTNKFSYRNLTLTALVTYSYGNDVYNYQRSQLESGSGFYNQSTVMLSRWTSEGQVTNQPKAVYGDPMGNARFSDRWIEDGSYLRLKSLTLSYNLPLKSNFIEGFNIWISANNLLTITKYLGVDPEFSSQNSVLYQGVDAGLLPFSKSYYVGLKFNL